MIGYIPDPTTFASHGGINVFTTVLGFIFLAALATVAVGGVLAGRHYLATVAARAKLDTTRARIDLSAAEHQLALGVHSHHNELLQLTSGEKKSDWQHPHPPEPVDEEDVDYDLTWDTKVPFQTNAEYLEMLRMKREATDVEVTPL